MNRDLFKAKRKSWKELPKEEWWVEGYLFDDGMPEPKHYFIGGIIVKPYEGTACDKWNVVGIDFYEIDINTLCQYTGLTDKNGKKIWENDIVECNKRKEECGLYKVIWRKEYADFGVVPISNTCIGQYPIGFSYGKTLHGRDYKSVGNIFDNPELLEVE